MPRADLSGGASRRGSPDDPLGNLWDDDVFRHCVRVLARNADIGLGELAKRAGISEPWLRHAPQRGRHIDMILRIAAALDVDFDDLIRPAVRRPGVLPSLKDRLP